MARPIGGVGQGIDGSKERLYPKRFQVMMTLERLAQERYRERGWRWPEELPDPDKSREE